jgi:PBP superfamily domain
MMKTQLRKLLWIVPGALILMGTQYANAQDLSRMTTRDMLLKIRTMNVDQMSQIVRSMDRDTMTHIIQSMDSQTMTQIVRSLDPNTVSAMAKRILVEFTKARPRSVPASSKAPQTNQQALGNTRVEIAAVVAPNGSDVQSLEGTREEQMDLTGLTVMIHPSNPVSELTLKQIQNIYTGEYTNWNQVGGPDLPIKVLTVGGEPAGGQVKLTSTAIISAFASSVFLGVAGTTGSIGFLPQMQSRQLRFIGGNQAVKTMAVKINLPAKQARTAHAGPANSAADLLLAYSR